MPVDSTLFSSVLSTGINLNLFVTSPYPDIESQLEALIVSGEIEQSEKKYGVDILETYDFEDEIHAYLEEKEIEFIEELDQIQMKDVVSKILPKLEQSELELYKRLHAGHQLLEMLKKISNQKIVTVSTKNNMTRFIIQPNGEVQGPKRQMGNSYQRELLEMLLNDDASVIVRVMTDFVQDEEQLEIVYGFRSEGGAFVQVPKEQLARAFQNKLPNEIFDELK